MNKTDLALRCEDCGNLYRKPEYYQNPKPKNIFFVMSIKYCDLCRRKREHKMLERLGEVVTALSETFEQDKPNKENGETEKNKNLQTEVQDGRRKRTASEKKK